MKKEILNSKIQKKKVYIFNEKLEKIQIFLLAPFRIVVLCTKTLTEASMMLELKKKYFFCISIMHLT